MKNFVIVSFCTHGSYEEESKRLKESLCRLGLFYEIKVIESLGSWNKNCNYKPFFIKEMILKHRLPVLYVDADAVFHKFPELISKIDADFGVHYFNNIQLAGGTLYFNKTAAALTLLDNWIEKNRLNPKALDQQNLQEIIEMPCWRNRLKIFYLPVEYYKVFDLSKNVKDPVIEHFQASRRLRVG